MSMRARVGGQVAAKCLTDFQRLENLASPEIVPAPSELAVANGRSLIRHEADVPVLLSAIAANPDWLLTNNTKHFTKSVAQRTALRIATPGEFFKALAGPMLA